MHFVGCSDAQLSSIVSWKLSMSSLIIFIVENVTMSAHQKLSCKEHDKILLLLANYGSKMLRYELWFSVRCTPWKRVVPLQKKINQFSLDGHFSKQCLVSGSKVSEKYIVIRYNCLKACVFWTSCTHQRHFRDTDTHERSMLLLWPHFPFVTL